MAMLTEPNQPVIREDLADELIVVDMHKCPFTTMVRKGKRIDNMLFEWPVDAYAAAAITPTVDGTAVGSGEYEDPAASRVKLQGRGHYRRRVPAVSKLAAEVSDVAGVGKGREYPKGVQKKLVELKRDMELTNLGEQESDADDGASQGYQTRGLGKWIQNGAQTDLPVNASFRTPAASIHTGVLGSMTESHIQGVLESIWGQTGGNQSYQTFCGSKVKRQFTEFMTAGTQSTTVLPLRRFTQQAESNKIELHVDVFEGDFGTLILIPDNFMPDAYTAYICDMDMLEIRPHTMPGHEKLANDGSGERGVVDAVWGLCCLNPLGLGKIDTTAS